MQSKAVLSTLSEEGTFPYWREYPPCGLIRARCTYAGPLKLQIITHKANTLGSGDPSRRPYVPVRHYALESSSQRPMFSLAEQDTSNSKQRFFVLSDSSNTPLMHLKRTHASDTVWEGYDCWTRELLFRIAPALIDPNNLMKVSFRDAAASPAAEVQGETDKAEADRPTSGESSDPPTLPRLADFEADWPVPSERHAGGYDSGDVLPCLISNWRALHTRERVYLFTRQCSRSGCLAEAVLAPRFDVAFGAAVAFICAIQQAAGFLSS